MRYVNVLTATAAVVVGFAGSLTAAQALSLPSGQPPLPQAVTGLLPVLGESGGTSLTVTYRADKSSAPVVMSLTCDPAGGDHPRAPEACERLDADAQNGTDPFAAPPKDEICTFIYGGPQTATVVGRWNGEDVNAKFARTNGCEIARWNALEPVLSPTKTPAHSAGTAAPARVS